MPMIEGDLTSPTGRFAVVTARFNSLIVDALLSGALDGLRRGGVSDDRIDVVRVPGAFEIPLVAKALAETSRYSAVICLGAVIKGDTDHYDHVAGAATSGVLDASMSTGVPVVFGVLTCDTLEQAMNRAGGKAGNKGHESALTALEMASLMAKVAKKGK